MASEYGELATTPFVNGSTACNSTIDAFVNFPPVGAYVHFGFQFLLPEAIPEYSGDLYNGYAQRERFGIVGADIKVYKYSSTGKFAYL